MANDIIDINVYETTETVAITVNPNLTTVNINQVTSSGGDTNLEYTPSPTNGIVTSSTGTDATIPLADGTNAGLLTAAEKTKIANSVPYTGAVSDVNLGEFGIQLGNLEFDNTPTNIPTAAGSMYYNDTDGTLDLKLKGGNVTLQIGQEQVVRVVNKTATNIDLLESNYQAIRITGAQGQRIKVDLAQATNDVLSSETIGLVTETIANNAEGFVTTSGLIRGINTTGSLQSETWLDGDILYLSPTVAGRITKVKPTAPNHLIIIGYVISAHITQGTIFVKVNNGYELDELHNVKITTAANNNVLAYTSATDIWENKTVETALGYTPYNATNPTGYQTAAQVQTIADAKVVQTITNGVTATAPSQDAVFDALALKQDTITLTTTGTSGASTLVGATLNIPQYSGATNLGYTAAPTNGTITSSTGSSATLPLADVTNAGLLKPAKFTVLENTSGTNTGDQDLSSLAPKASPTFTGTVVLPSTTSIGNVTDTEIGYLDGVTSVIQTQIDGKLTIPVWQDFTSTQVGWSSTTTFLVRYAIIGKIVIVYFRISGTSNSTTTTITMPFINNGTSNISILTTGLNANGAVIANSTIATGGNVLSANYFNTIGSTTSFTATGTKQIAGTITYEIP